GRPALHSFPTRRSSDLAQLEAGHMRGPGKGGDDFLAVAEMKIEPDIARHIVIEDRCPGGVGSAGDGDSRQWFDLDLDRLNGVLRSEEHTSELQSPDHLV